MDDGLDDRYRFEWRVTLEYILDDGLDDVDDAGLRFGWPFGWCFGVHTPDSRLQSDSRLRVTILLPLFLTCYHFVTIFLTCYHFVIILWPLLVICVRKCLMTSRLQPVEIIMSLISISSLVSIPIFSSIESI